MQIEKFDYVFHYRHLAQYSIPTDIFTLRSMEQIRIYAVVVDTFLIRNTCSSQCPIGSYLHL